MSYAVDRYEFIQLMESEGMNKRQVERILAYSTTLDRLATAMCNGDYPCDNGQRKTKPCSKCEMGYASSSLIKNGVCPECRTQINVEKLLVGCPSGFKAIFSGDPRGCVLKIKVPSSKTDDWGHEGICVPSSFKG